MIRKKGINTMSILLTGFAPFDGASINPSWEAVQRVPQTIAGHDVHRLMLPVEFEHAASLLREEIAKVRPQLVICCGLAAGRKAITPELVAINYRFARIADNAGRLCQGEAITITGPAAYMTSLPVHAMIARLQSAELPAALSLSAGAYVCNDVYYALLACQEEYGHRGLFLHVPSEDVADDAACARAITLCAETALA